MLLRAKSYADLKPFEMLAKRVGVFVEITENKTTDNIMKFNEMCKEARKFAKETGLMQNDISVAIKKVRTEKCR